MREKLRLLGAELPDVGDDDALLCVELELSAAKLPCVGVTVVVSVELELTVTELPGVGVEWRV